jgi:hypothetical protein
MNTYKVEIKETLCMTVEVEANSPEQAEEMVSDEWRNGEFVLDSDHFQGVVFEAKPLQKSKDYIDDDEVQQHDEKIKVVLVKPMQKPQIVEIGTSLEDMQKIVGGLIEQVMPFDEEVALVCNEEGKNDGLELNRALKYPDGEIADIIAGDFFICSAKGENFTSLTDEQAQRYSEMFKNPEYFYQTADGIKAVSVTPAKNRDYDR